MASLELPSAASIAAAVIERYRALGINEPDGAAWTVLAGIVAEDTKNEELQVVSIASGCKCPGAVSGEEDALRNDGDIVKDAHAEILARRGLIAALLENKALLRNEMRFHMFTSSPPCGDASIYKEIDGRLRFTGAKLGSWRREPGDQILAATRTKPTRYDSMYRSNSLSCTDKMILWSILGMQGAFLEKRIYLSSLTVAAPAVELVESVREAVLRGIVRRASAFANELEVPLPSLAVRVISDNYSGPAHSTKKKPSHLATAWWLSSHNGIERLVASTGRPLGARAASTKRSRLSSNTLFELSASSHTSRSEAKAHAPHAELKSRLTALLLKDFPLDHPRKRRLHIADAEDDVTMTRRKLKRQQVHGSSLDTSCCLS